MGRMEKLQKAFSSLQATSERREEMDKQLRMRLEQELEAYKAEERVCCFYFYTLYYPFSAKWGRLTWVRLYSSCNSSATQSYKCILGLFMFS